MSLNYINSSSTCTIHYIPHKILLPPKFQFVQIWLNFKIIFLHHFWTCVPICEHMRVVYHFPVNRYVFSIHGIVSSFCTIDLHTYKVKNGPGHPCYCLTGTSKSHTNNIVYKCINQIKQSQESVRHMWWKSTHFVKRNHGKLSPG